VSRSPAHPSISVIIGLSRTISRVRPNPHLVIGTKLADRYEILAELGRGGMGVVYRAKDPVLNRDVAVKLIPPGNLTKDAEERFQREAQIVAQMDHPGIVLCLARIP
jgi:serine/threonine protein kinase